MRRIQLRHLSATEPWLSDTSFRKIKFPWLILSLQKSQVGIFCELKEIPGSKINQGNELFNVRNQKHR